MNKVLLAALLAVLTIFSASAFAQQPPITGRVNNGCTPISGYVYTIGSPAPALLDLNTGSLCVTGTVTISPGSITVSTTPLVITPTDRGGTITAGGTAQSLAALNASRKFLFVENPCTAAGEGGIAAAEDLFISVTGNATVNGAGNYADLPPCGSASVAYNGTVFTAAVTVNAATTGHRWSATEGQ